MEMDAWAEILIWLGVGAGSGGGLVAFMGRMPAIVRAARGEESQQGDETPVRPVRNYTDSASLIRHDGLLEELWRLGVPAALVAADGTPIVGNDSLARLLDYGPATLAGRSIFDFGEPGANHDEDMRQWSRLVSGMIESYELQMKSWRTAGGDVIHGRLVVAQIPGATWGQNRIKVALLMIFDQTAWIKEKARRAAAEMELRILHSVGAYQVLSAHDNKHSDDDNEGV